MRTWWVFVLLVLGVSCLDEPDCLKSTGKVVKVDFIRLEENERDTVVIKSIAVAGLADTVFYQQFGTDLNDTVSFVLFEINPFAEASEVSFRFPDDTLAMVLHYRVTTRFISETCGADQVISELSVEDTEFDSVRVINSQLPNEPATNILIYN
jgi:hypothetical protein